MLPLGKHPDSTATKPPGPLDPPVISLASNETIISMVDKTIQNSLLIWTIVARRVGEPEKDEKRD